jgi:hypothetical protein
LASTLGGTAAALALSVWARPSAAFDHVDSSETEAVPAADIVDVYAFQRPERATAGGPFQKTNHLVLVMTTNPGATAATRFDPTVRHIFRVRAVGDAASLAADPFSGGDIACTFDDATPQHAACNANGVFAKGTAGQVDGQASAPLRVFIGLRSNPAFGDVDAFAQTVATGQNQLKTPGKNSFQGQNVLALVVDLDIATVFPGLTAPYPLLAVTGETARN